MSGNSSHPSRLRDIVRSLGFEPLLSDENSEAASHDSFSEELRGEFLESRELVDFWVWISLARREGRTILPDTLRERYYEAVQLFFNRKCKEFGLPEID